MTVIHGTYLFDRFASAMPALIDIDHKSNYHRRAATA